MQKVNPCVWPLLAASALLVSACGTASLSYDEGLQRAALERWSLCVDRQTQASAVKVVNDLETQSDDCQGHRRDVVESFPPHLGPRVEEMLNERRQRRAEERLLTAAGSEISANPVLMVRDAPSH